MNGPDCSGGIDSWPQTVAFIALLLFAGGFMLAVLWFLVHFLRAAWGGGEDR